jgi:hypothetical protein
VDSCDWQADGAARSGERANPVVNIERLTLGPVRTTANAVRP